jgi:hypothetical protein
MNASAECQVLIAPRRSTSESGNSENRRHVMVLPGSRFVRGVGDVEERQRVGGRPLARRESVQMKEATVVCSRRLPSSVVSAKLLAPTRTKKGWKVQSKRTLFQSGGVRDVSFKWARADSPDVWDWLKPPCPWW